MDYMYMAHMLVKSPSAAIQQAICAFPKKD